MLCSGIFRTVNYKIWDLDCLIPGDVYKRQGAVYGLYAREDIVYPDGATGTIYKAGEQVASLDVYKRQLMASGEELPENVKAIIADCGYTSEWDEFKCEANALHIPWFLSLIHISSTINEENPLTLIILKLLSILRGCTNFNVFFLLIKCVSITRTDIEAPIAVASPAPLSPISNVNTKK